MSDIKQTITENDILDLRQVMDIEESMAVKKEVDELNGITNTDEFNAGDYQEFYDTYKFFAAFRRI